MGKLFTYAAEKLKRWKKPLLLQKKQTNLCKSCYRRIRINSGHSLFVKSNYMCSECLRKMNPVFKEFKLDNINILSIFDYNEVIKEKLFLFKGCKDYELKYIFIEPFIHELKALYNGYIFIPMPSYYLTDQERGFNHVEEMFGCFGDRVVPILRKTSNVKQANLNSEERKEIKKHIELKEGVDISKYQNKNVCLIDDVCTTGSTLRTSLKIVAQLNPKKIKILVMASTILDEKGKNP